MTPTASLFIENAAREQYEGFFGKPIEDVRAALRERFQHNGFEFLSYGDERPGIPPRTTMAVSAYFSDPARVTSISLSLNMQCLLEDGAAPAPFVAELSKVWTELKAWLAERAGPLELHKTHYPQKRNALAAAPDLKKALKERHAFPGGRLEHEATIQGSTVFSYQIYLTYEAR